jgi:transposase
LVARGGRLLVDPCGRRGKKTGPNPTDRARPGSKHHVATDGQGIPLATIVTGANEHDVTQLIPLIDRIPSLRQRDGTRRRRPVIAIADRAYDSSEHRKALKRRGIGSLIARRGVGHGSGLGRLRWVVERTHSWLHQNRRLRVRFERLPSLHEAFLTIGCALVCWNFLRRSF